jgi:ADP-heptose:LPS heptosyltransferase
VLLVAGSHVGNNVFCTPAIAFLRKHLPDVRLDVVATSARGVAVFERNPDVDRVYSLERRWSVRRLARRYDVAVGLHWDQSRETLRGANVPSILIEPPPAGEHRADSLLRFAASLVGRPAEECDRRYVLCPDDRDRAALERALGHVEPAAPLVGFHLGTGRTAVHGWKFWWGKRALDPRMWPVARYAEAARLVRRAAPEARIVLTGSRNERFLGRAFARAVPGTIDLIGRTSLLELVALMTRLRVFVTQDNGALHVACATDVPIVGLFGPTRLAETGMFPARPHHVAIERPTIDEIRPGDVSSAIAVWLRGAERVEA